MIIESIVRTIQAKIHLSTHHGLALYGSVRLSNMCVQEDLWVAGEAGRGACDGRKSGGDSGTSGERGHYDGQCFVCVCVLFLIIVFLCKRRL